MGDPLQTAVNGQPSPFVVSLATVNSVLDAARDWRSKRLGEFGREVATDPRFPAVYCHIRNDTGSNLDERSVVALGSPVVSAVDFPFDVSRGPIFPGTAPAAATDAFAVLVEPVPYNGYGLAAVMGLAVCDLDVSDAAHTCAVPAVGVTATLASSASGPARIVWKESGTGTKRAVVLIGRDTAAADTGEGEETSSAGYGWVAGLTEDDCLLLTVLSAAGRCSAIDVDQELRLVYDAGTWTSASADPADFTHDGGAGPAIFSLTADGVPRLEIDGAVGVIDGGGTDEDGDPYIDFAFGGTTLCAEDPGACGGNVFKVRLFCTRCGVRPGYTKAVDELGMTQYASAQVCARLFGDVTLFGAVGDGRYTGDRGTPLNVHTAGDLEQCDVYVYHWGYYYDNPDPAAPTFAEIGEWVAAGGRAILLTPYNSGGGGDPGNTWRSRVNVALSDLGTTMRMSSSPSTGPEGSAGACGYPLNVAAVPLTAGVGALTYPSASLVPVSGGTPLVRLPSTTIVAAIEKVGLGYVLIAPAPMFPLGGSCVNVLDLGENFRDIEDLL